jgi:hypothetical protein
MLNPQPEQRRRVLPDSVSGLKQTEVYFTVIQLSHGKNKDSVVR